MEETFKQLKKEGQNCVDNLMKWMKDSHIMEETREAEERTRKLFDKIKDEQNVELEKFREVVRRLAEEHHNTVQEYSRRLGAAGPRLREAVEAAARAFQEALSKK